MAEKPREPSRPRQRLRAILWRGLRRVCPRCGDAPQFKSWFTLHDNCERCHLAFEPRPGDTWGFWIAGDRVFVAITIALLYFGVRPQSTWARLTLLGILIAATILTMPQRQGVCTALDYFFRVKQGEED